MILRWGLSNQLIEANGFQFYVRDEFRHPGHPKTLSEPGALTPGLNWFRAKLPVRAILGRTGGLQLPMIKADVLGIWSSGDLYLTEEAMTRSMQRVQGTWRYERFEGSYWVPLDQPDRLNRLLLDFLS